VDQVYFLGAAYVVNRMMDKLGAPSRYVWKFFQRIPSGKASIIPFPSISYRFVPNIPLSRQRF
jgi:hypothetical protein